MLDVLKFSKLAHPSLPVLSGGMLREPTAIDINGDLLKARLNIRSVAKLKRVVLVCLNQAFKG